MDERGWLYILLGAMVVLLFCCLRGLGKLHKGIHRIFCAIPCRADDMMNGFCKGMTKAAEERSTVITEKNFDIIKKLYNETEDNKIGYLLDVMFRKYACTVLVSVSAFMLTLVANQDAKSFIDFFISLNPGVTALFILLIAFSKTLSNRAFVTEEEIYRKNVTFEMWRDYMDTHDIENIKDSNKKNYIKTFWMKEKWMILFVIYMTLGIGYFAWQFITTKFKLPDILFIVIAFIVIVVIVTFDYADKVRKQEGLWEKINVWSHIKDEEQCFRAIRDEIIKYKNLENDENKVVQNLNIVEAMIAKEKAIVVLFPIVLSVFTWFTGNENILLTELFQYSLDSLVRFILTAASLFAVLVSLVQYPKLAFTEKVVEKIREESKNGLCENK